MPTKRDGLCTASLNGKIYAIYGYNNGYLNTVEIYDPVSNIWATGSTMLTRRSYATATVLDGAIIVIGGISPNDDTSIFEFYSDDNNWGRLSLGEHVGSMSPTISSAASASIYGKIYVFGGISGGAEIKGVYKYQPRTIQYGEVNSITDRNGNKYSFMRDERGNIIKQTNPDGSYKHYECDENDNVIMEKDESGKTTWYIYDANKINLVKKIQPLNGTDEYIDGVSNDGDFAITKYIYYNDDECKQLGYKVKGLIKSVVDPEGNISSYTYNSDGNVKTFSSIDANTVFSPTATPTNTPYITPAPTPTPVAIPSGFNVKTFGGSSDDCFESVISTSDGNVAVGYSQSSDGDLSTLSKGERDAIIVKYDLNKMLMFNFIVTVKRTLVFGSQFNQRIIKLLKYK